MDNDVDNKLHFDGLDYFFILFYWAGLQTVPKMVKIELIPL